jgi:tRNA(Ile)-lysidine synthase
VHMVETINRFQQVRRRLLQDLGRDPTVEELLIPKWGIKVSARKVSSATAKQEIKRRMKTNHTSANPVHSEYFDLKHLKFPLTLRARRPGDRIIPFGSTHSKKLKEILINQKIPLWKRGRLPIVENNHGILAALGAVRGDAAPVSSQTAHTLELKMENIHGN